MTDVAAECRAAIAACHGDGPAGRICAPLLVGRGGLRRHAAASQMMLSAAYLLGDVLLSGLGTAFGHHPTQAEIMQAWEQTAKQARQRLTSSPEAAAMDAGMVTALPLLSAFISRDMAAFDRGCAAAVGKKQLTMAVLATSLIIRDLFETAVNTAANSVATDEQVRHEWETFMARRAASTRRV